MSTGPVYVGDSFRIEWRWKEEVAYWEAENGFLLDAAWGVKPPHLFVPTAAAWDVVVPDWLQGRRDVVLTRLRSHSAHEVFEDPAYSEPQPIRCLHSS